MSALNLGRVGTPIPQKISQNRHKTLSIYPLSVFSASGVVAFGKPFGLRLFG
ncbi:MAG: hypothetical protein V7K50_27565 [Nostoc sp.]|uniref:hypothetical protein n=1 Tax=Nostoc sp. TaxID=1180 RepID=UPI002FFB2F7A